jgi:autotransporter-associated beta strand protein
MTIIDSSFTGNIATNAQGTALGGAIANSFVNASLIGELTLPVTPGHTSSFSGNTAEGQASSIFFDNKGGGLTVNVAAGGLLDMRDPMSGAPPSVSGVGQGVWALGGANGFSTISPFFGPTMFSVNSGILYLYAAGEVANPSNSNGQVAAGTIALNASGSSFTLGAGATLVAAGANSISVVGNVLLADGATIRGGTAADGSLVHVPLFGGITSSLALTATAGVGLQGQLTVQAVAPDDTFTLAADLANAPGSTGSLLVPGAGTVILTGANRPDDDCGRQAAGWSNRTFPMSSAFTVAAGAILDLNNFNQSIGSLAGAGSVTLGSATLTTGNDNTSTTFSGIISGDGGLTKVGSGTFTLTGENTYTGGTTISGGTLQLGDGGPTGSIVGDVLDNGTLIFNRSGAKKTFAGVISGNGAVVKLGSDILELDGDNTYSGGTTINDGTLVVGTLIAADQPISTALGTGNVFLDPGTLRTTSASTGVPLIINVGGNYTQAAGGTLVLGIGGTQGEQYDHVQVKGSATLGGTLVVNSLGGFHPANLNLFEVLSSGGKRSGEFATVTDNINIDPNLRRVDIYAPNGAALLYIATAAPTPTPTPTPPTPGPSPSPSPSPAPSPTPVPPKPPIIDVIPEPLPPVNPDAPLPVSFLLAALNPTAEQLTSMFEISISGANTQRFNLTDRMAQIQRGSTGFVSPVAPAPPPAPTGKEIEKKEVVPPALVPGPTNRWGVWVNGWGDWVNVNDDNGVKGYNFTTGGVSVGIDYRITDYLAIGIFGTYAHTWTSLNPGSIDVNTGRGGLYATYWNQGFYINGAVYAGGNSYDTSRNELTNTSANGSTSGYEVSTFVDTGYDFHFENLSFSVQFSPLNTQPFTSTALPNEARSCP